MMKDLKWFLCLGILFFSGCASAPPIPKDESPQHPLGMGGMLGKQDAAKAYANRMQGKLKGNSP